MGGKTGTLPPPCVDGVHRSVLPKRLQLKMEAVFGFRNLTRPDLVVKERCPADLTSRLFVWFPARLTSAAPGRAVSACTTSSPSLKLCFYMFGFVLFFFKAQMKSPIWAWRRCPCASMWMCFSRSASFAGTV